MGSIGAMQQGNADRYFQESTTGNPNADKLGLKASKAVPYKGSMVASCTRWRAACVHGLLRLRHDRR